MRESKRRNEIKGESRRGERERERGGLGDRESERGRERCRWRRGSERGRE